MFFEIVPKIHYLCSQWYLSSTNYDKEDRYLKFDENWFVEDATEIVKVSSSCAFL